MDPLEGLTSQQLTDLIERLTLYARTKMLRLWFRGVRFRQGMTGIKGVGPDDLVQEVFLAHLRSKETGTRVFDPTKGETFEEFLKGIIDSRVSDYARLLENKKTREVESAPAGPTRAAAPEPRSREPSPDFAPMATESYRKLQELVQPLLAEDPQAAELFEGLCGGLSRSELAEYMGVDVLQVDAIKKRLVRTIGKAVDKFGRSLT